MPALTAFILAALAGYCVTWYAGYIEGNFPLLLLVATVITGAYWLAERFFFLPRRRAAAFALEARHDARRAELAAQGISQVDADISEARERLLSQPWWLDWTAGLFPIILAVFLLRSFVFEPFRIPSGSMIPTLRIDDLILVNKFTYGIRLPVFNTRVTQGNPIQRGDVVVFHYPLQPSLDYIKRVVGLPGDEVTYLNKQITVNGQPVPQTPDGEFLDKSTVQYFRQMQETPAPGKQHNIIVDDQRPTLIPSVTQFPHRDLCQYSIEGVRCKVPPGHYFMMGDNRDNSLDSRYWGFVPDDYIVGKAFFVWMNIGDLSRIGFFN
jgi:hypothetical protein